jgi:hypothetical protein
MIYSITSQLFNRFLIAFLSPTYRLLIAFSFPFSLLPNRFLVVSHHFGKICGLAIALQKLYNSFVIT